MLSPDEIATLSRELIAVAFASALIAAGLAALLLPAIHRPARNLSLAAFGSAVLLYGVRVLAGLASFRSAMPGSEGIWDSTEAVCTYLLPVAVFVFADHHWGAGWRSSVRRVWQIHLTYAIIAVGVDAATRTPGAAIGPNEPLVLLWMAVMLLNLLTGRLAFGREGGVVRVSLAVLVVAITHDNLVSLGLVPWSLEIESVGIVIFVGCLGYALALRTFDNERRLATLDYELRTARRIQQSLLPREAPPTRDGALGVRYIPMAAVGGDLYDYLQVDDRHLGVLVADVTGHGIPAALIASMVKTAASAQTLVADQPSEVLSGINRHLCGQVDGHYVTAVYVYIDFDTGHVSLSNAGHPPPILLSRSTGQAGPVGDSGLLLGFIPDAEYSTTTLSLAAGDRLVLYTDGVVEAASPGDEFFETARLQETLVSGADLSADRWAGHLLDRLTTWSGKARLELDDDLTVVVLDVPRVGGIAENPG